jgi:hypothetical protein
MGIRRFPKKVFVLYFSQKYNANMEDKLKANHKLTPSVVCEIPLAVSLPQEKILLKRLEAARQVYNACLGEALRRMKRLRESMLYRKALRENKENPSRQVMFKTAKEKCGFQDYALQSCAVKLRKSWLGKHLDVHSTQKVAKRAFKAVERILYRKARKVRFKTFNQMDSIEGKSNETGIRWRKDHVEWNGLLLKGIIEKQDLLIGYGLSLRTKYVRLVRRKVNGKNRFYAQLVCEGKSYQKPKNKLGCGTVGLDIGPSTIAVVGEKEAFLEQFCSQLANKEQEIRRLQRKLDRQRRTNNPDNYNPDGTVKKGKKEWKNSRQYYLKLDRLAEIYRRLKEHRKSLQGWLINIILLMGNIFLLEKVSYKAWQKLFGKSVGKRAPGRFVFELRRKAERAGGKVKEFPTKSTKLSQTCHCGKRHKKRLSERWHTCNCGVSAQRDLYSAFLARFVDSFSFFLHADQAQKAWSGAESLLWAAWKKAIKPASGRVVPSSFGANQSQSGSSRKGR